MTRLLFIRHCEPEPESRGRCYGTLDYGLSTAGRAAAASLALAVDAVVSSPRLRALETARPLAAANGVEAQVDERLRELDFGELEGLTYENVERTRPELFRRWMEAPTEVEFPGGESYARLRGRVDAAVADLRVAHAGRAVAVVTHGGPIRAALASCLDMPAAAIFRLGQDYGGLSVVEWFADEPVVRCVNARG